MLKFLIIADPDAEQKLRLKLRDIEGNINSINPKHWYENVEQISQADYVIADSAKLIEILEKNRPKPPQRQHIKAVTHQGIRLVPLENIYYFQAEHKYVTAVHTNGSLLIEDSLTSLEQEFAELFIRIHRKTLVAKQQIEFLKKDEQGQFVVKLRISDELFAVSRRQVPAVRKVLLCL